MCFVCSSHPNCMSDLLFEHLSILRFHLQGFKSQLRSQNKRVKSRALDLIIAATALEDGLTLVTNNTDDFKDIPDLTLYQPR
jgi:predicted nucleic acid-binding protein